MSDTKVKLTTLHQHHIEAFLTDSIEAYRVGCDLVHTTLFLASLQLPRQ
jgi:hypothetical protein